ncbi:MAG TPA: long-chain fatty acid--CoA ligase, partial [Actinomycetota bacterium]
MNASDLLRQAAEKFGDKPALIFRGASISFADLDERVDRAAAALFRLGIHRGDRVALLAGNVPEFVYALYGTMRAGAVACPLNVMLTPEEMGYILADAGARLAITDLRSLPGLLSVRDRLGALGTVVVIGGPPAPTGTVSLEEALRGDATPPRVETKDSDLAVIAYTAGTTADPKGAMLTHGNLLSNLDQMSAVPALAEASDDVGLLALPLFHIYALNVVLGITMKTGATAVLVERFDPGETLELVKRHRVTVLFGAPPMFQAWLALAGEGVEVDLSTVRLAVSGAAPLPSAVLNAFRDRFGVTIWEGYGLTEAAPAVTTNALGPEAKPGSIGLPLPGLEVRLVDEQGEDVEEGDPGEVLVRGPNVFAGYWQRPEETANVIEGDWLKTGDVAVRDDDGYLYLVDRKKDLIIVSGFNVFPKEVEEAIAKHPKVAEAAVVGIPDERTGEAVGAWVVPKPGQSLTEDEIREFLNGYLARFKWPKQLRIVESLPHHVTGKVLRRTLRQSDVSEAEQLFAAARDGRPN